MRYGEWKWKKSGEGYTYDGADEGDEVVLQHGALHTRKISPFDIVLPILVPALLLQELEVRKTCPNDGSSTLQSFPEERCKCGCKRGREPRTGPRKFR